MPLSSFDPLGLRQRETSSVSEKEKLYSQQDHVARDRRREAFSWLFEQPACVQTDQGVNAEGSRCAFKTVCPALFMLLRIDNTVSPGEARRVFFFFLSHSRSAVLGGMKVMVRRNHFVVASSIFSVLLRTAGPRYLPTLSANILH